MLTKSENLNMGHVKNFSFISPFCNLTTICAFQWKCSEQINSEIGNSEKFGVFAYGFQLEIGIILLMLVLIFQRLRIWNQLT